MSYCNKTGTTYRSNQEESTGLLPTKNGYEQFVVRPTKLDKSWVAVNNTIAKMDELLTGEKPTYSAGLEGRKLYEKNLCEFYLLASQLLINRL